ncbi:1-acyl-sn-glycerol-3-phosphate acyltransferase [Myxococcota bacterium]|nr:1-acyl-sn-glycerol-3-phosphate acyltransferase [Myxococcota bacterium]
MVPAVGWLARRIGDWLFQGVRFDEATRSLLLEAHQRGILVAVFYARSLLDYLFLSWAFVRYGLPLVIFAEGMDLRWTRPREFLRGIWRRLFGRDRTPGDSRSIRAALAAGGPVLIHLKRPHTLIQFGGEPQGNLLPEIVSFQRSQDRPLVLVPLMITWYQAPESYRRSLLDVILGDPLAPGRLRKILSFLWNRRRAQVQAGHPLDLPVFLAEQGDAPEPTLVARLKFLMVNEFLQESKAIRGPLLKTARQIIDEMMRSPPLLEAVTRLAQEEGLVPSAQIKRVRSILRKMAADFRFAVLESFALMLGVIFGRMFTGLAVDTRELQAIREAARKGPIVLVSAHRSHMDYLFYSFLFYTHGLIVPHICAGENLSFWPMGWIFRKSGAFFIRRSVREDRLYSLVLGHYVRKLLKEGYWIEFFLEGTRSRTGKMLPPRTGLLSMIVDTVATGGAQDVQIVPASITYERVVEMASYRRESEGGTKRPEGVADIARGARVLGTRYGRLYVRFDRPMSLADHLRRQGVRLPREEGGEALDPGVIRHLAHLIAHRILATLVATPQQLVAFALLTHGRRGIERSLLVQRVGQVLMAWRRRGGMISDPLVEGLRKAGLPAVQGGGGDGEEAIAGDGKAHGEAVETSILEVVRLFAKEGLIQVGVFGDEEVIIVREEGRFALDYHKNGLVNHFVDDALLATAAMRLAGIGDRSFTRESLTEETRVLSMVFRREFIYGLWGFPEAFQRTLRRAQQEGLLVEESGLFRVSPGAMEEVRWLARITQPFLEAYRVVARVAGDPGAPIHSKDLVKAAMRLGKRLQATGEIEMPESISTVTYGNAIAWLEEQVSSGRASSRAQALAELRRGVEGPPAAPDGKGP